MVSTLNLFLFRLPVKLFMAASGIEINNYFYIFCAIISTLGIYVKLNLLINKGVVFTFIEVLSFFIYSFILLIIFLPIIGEISCLIFLSFTPIIYLDSIHGDEFNSVNNRTSPSRRSISPNSTRVQVHNGPRHSPFSLLARTPSPQG